MSGTDVVITLLTLFVVGGTIVVIYYTKKMLDKFDEAARDNLYSLIADKELRDKQGK